MSKKEFSFIHSFFLGLFCLSISAYLGNLPRLVEACFGSIYPPVGLVAVVVYGAIFSFILCDYFSIHICLRNSRDLTEFPASLQLEHLGNP